MVRVNRDSITYLRSRQVVTAVLVGTVLALAAEWTPAFGEEGWVGLATIFFLGVLILVSCVRLYWAIGIDSTIEPDLAIQLRRRVAVLGPAAALEIVIAAKK